MLIAKDVRPMKYKSVIRTELRRFNAILSKVLDIRHGSKKVSIVLQKKGRVCEEMAVVKNFCLFVCEAR